MVQKRMRRGRGVQVVLALAGLFGLVVALFGHNSGRPAATVSAAPAVSTSPLAGDGLLVMYKSAADLGSVSAGVAGRAGGKEVGRIAPLRISLVETAGADIGSVISALKSDPRVAAVQRNAVRRASVLPNDSYYSQQWAPTRINLPAAWDITQGSNAITIAIIDTGVWLDHPDLLGRFVPGYDFVNDDSDPDDDHGHGTHVAGIAAAGGNNNAGIAGVSWNSRIMPLKILDGNGDGFDADLIAAAIFATDNGAKVINLSLGGTCNDPDNPTDPFPVLRAGMEYALSRGVLIAAAAGNNRHDGSPNVDCPAAYAGMTAVSSTTSSDGVSGFSSWGPQVAVSAPGSSIISTLATGSCELCTPNGSDPYGYLSGTSMATPHVAGLAALIWAANPALSNTEVRQLMQATSVDLGEPGFDGLYGAGRIDAGAALTAANGGGGGGGTPTATCSGVRVCGSVPTGTATATATATSAATATATVSPTAPAGCSRNCPATATATATATVTVIPTATATATPTATACGRGGCAGATATATSTATPTITATATVTPTATATACGRTGCASVTATSTATATATPTPTPTATAPLPCRLNC